MRNNKKITIQKEKLESLINNNLSLKEISKNLNTSETTVRRLLKEHNLKAKRLRYEIFIINNIKFKTCPTCKETKEVNYENFYISKKDKHCSWCRTCSNKKTISRQIKKKLKCVEYKGGKCCICDYNKYIGALEFHHLDPSKKDFDIGSMQRNSFKRVEPELKKCILVCSNCHREIHAGLIIIPPRTDSEHPPKKQ